MKRLFEVCPAARQVTVQAKRRIEAQMFAKTRLAFSESNNKGR